jgi:hypothetical protein
VEKDKAENKATAEAGSGNELVQSGRDTDHVKFAKNIAIFDANNDVFQTQKR